MKYTYNDGGREAAGFDGHAGDCAVRSIAIATGKPYREVYDDINALGKRERTGKRKRGRSNSRTGVYGATVRRYMDRLGYTWTPTMHIGSGCTVHLKANELPRGRLLVFVSKHFTAVVNHVVHDTHDPARGGTRCVYGYYKCG